MVIAVDPETQAMLAVDSGHNFNLTVGFCKRRCVRPCFDGDLPRSNTRSKIRMPADLRRAARRSPSEPRPTPLCYGSTIFKGTLHEPQRHDQPRRSHCHHHHRRSGLLSGRRSRGGAGLPDVRPIPDETRRGYRCWRKGLSRPGRRATLPWRENGRLGSIHRIFGGVRNGDASRGRQSPLINKPLWSCDSAG